MLVLENRASFGDVEDIFVDDGYVVNQDGTIRSNVRTFVPGRYNLHIMNENAVIVCEERVDPNLIHTFLEKSNTGQDLRCENYINRHDWMRTGETAAVVNTPTPAVVAPTVEAVEKVTTEAAPAKEDDSDDSDYVYREKKDAYDDDEEESYDDEDDSFNLSESSDPTKPAVETKECALDNVVGSLAIDGQVAVAVPEDTAEPDDESEQMSSDADKPEEDSDEDVDSTSEEAVRRKFKRFIRQRFPTDDYHQIVYFVNYEQIALIKNLQVDIEQNPSNPLIWNLINKNDINRQQVGFLIDGRNMLKNGDWNFGCCLVDKNTKNCFAFVIERYYTPNNTTPAPAVTADSAPQSNRLPFVNDVVKSKYTYDMDTFFFKNQSIVQ